MSERPIRRSRPSPELLARLRAGKAALRRQRESLSLREKVEAVLVLQRVYYELIRRQRALEPWEVPWQIAP
jgi:hypothetical protein